MSQLADDTKLDLKLGAYGVAPAAALADGGALAKVQGYRRTLRSRMMAMDKSWAKDKLPPGGYHVSVKIDGEFNGLLFAGSEALLVNPGGTVRVGLPLLDEAATALGDAGVGSALVAGELYAALGDGRRERVHDVSRIARKPGSAAEVEALRFAVFDLIELDDAPPAAFADTWARIVELFAGGTRVHPVESAEADSPGAVLDHFEEWVEGRGAEGLVARSDAAGLFKIKPLHTLDLAVVGFAEGIDDRAGMLHDLLLAAVRADGAFHIIGRVGGGFSDEQRRAMLSDLKDREAASDYAEVNSDRVAYQMVEPGPVVEVSCLDMISESTRGASIDRMVLGWDAGAGWRASRRMPIASLISPVFKRLRDDKSPTPEEAGLAQIAKVIEVPEADAPSTEADAPASELLRREVATKELKGALMVRKLLLWKTNKESTGRFPAYVATLTDFSPNRKEPLSRELRASDSLEQIEALYGKLKEKNFVRGWTPVEQS